mgnify:CR=1 FL=1
MLEPLAGFMVRFGICNLILSGIIGLLFGNQMVVPRISIKSHAI